MDGCCSIIFSLIKEVAGSQQSKPLPKISKLGTELELKLTYSEDTSHLSAYILSLMDTGLRGSLRSTTSNTSSLDKEAFYLGYFSVLVWCCCFPQLGRFVQDVSFISRVI